MASPEIFCQPAFLACTDLFLLQGSRQSIASLYIKKAMNGQVRLRGEGDSHTPRGVLALAPQGLQAQTVVWIAWV